MTIENGWALWAIAFLSLVGAFHIIAFLFKWINEWFDVKALFRSNKNETDKCMFK